MTAYIAEARRVSSEAKKQTTVTPEGLVLRHLALPVAIATEITRRAGLRNWLDELVAVGNLALLEALRTYDSSKGSFGAYAKQRIRGAMIDALDLGTSGGATTSDRAFRDRRAIQRAAYRLETEGMASTVSVLAKETGLPEGRITELLPLILGFVPLDVQTDGPDGTQATLGELIPHEGPDPETTVLDALEGKERQELYRAIERLSEPHRVAVGLTAGAPCFEEASLADVLGANMSYPRQSIARQNLRNMFREGKADARKLGYEPSEATGAGPSSRLSSITTGFGRGPGPERDRAEDLWHRLTDRWREAAEVGAG